MPNDIAIIAPLIKTGLTKGHRRAVGATEFIFEPYENDIQFDRLRTIRQVSGTDKLVQSIMRILLTTVGESFEDAEWGSEVNNQIGTNINNETFAEVRESIIKALAHYNDINIDNENSDEVIDTIDELQVVNDIDDPRIVRVVVGVTTESGTGLRVIVPRVEL